MYVGGYRLREIQLHILLPEVGGEDKEYDDLLVGGFGVQCGSL